MFSLSTIIRCIWDNGALIVLLMIFMPMGLAGLLKDQYQKLRKLLTGKRKKTTAKESA